MSAGTTPRSSLRGYQRRRVSPIGCRPKLSGNTRREEERRRLTGGERKWAWDTPQCAECGGRENGKTVPSGSFRANAFGLYDTAGNAAEWVEDCWNPTYRGAPNNGSAWTNGDCSLRVLRGGSFADKALALRSPARFRYDEDVRYYANGFRAARDLN
jgi:formylglycine-generating enzyme required for sulfatase activity